MNALRAELLRLRTDVVLGGGLALSVVLAVGSAVTAPEAGAVGALTQAVLLALFCGAVRYCVDHRSGVVVRSVLTVHRGPMFLGRAVASALGGALVGLVGVLALWLAGMTVSVGTAGFGVLASAVGAVFGLCAGMVLRNYFLAPLAGFLAYLGSGMVLSVWPEGARVLPMPSALATLDAGNAVLLPVGLGVVVQLAWLGVFGALTLGVLRVRDL